LEFFGGVAAGIPKLAGAVTLAIGIGIQNFPEGIAVSMPLRRMGMSRWKVYVWAIFRVSLLQLF
jgi:ZIP family zinc transporter